MRRQTALPAQFKPQPPLQMSLASEERYRRPLEQRKVESRRPRRVVGFIENIDRKSRIFATLNKAAFCRCEK